MYDSIKPWINVPATLKAYIDVSGTGSKRFEPDLSILCYPEGKVQVVKNNYGNEVVSNQILYMLGSVAVKPLDEVIIDGLAWQVLAVNTFFRNGVPDIRVVYI